MLVSLSETVVIAPNFKKRLSGVTSTIVHLIPLQRAQGVHIATLGMGLPDYLPQLSWSSLGHLWKQPPGHPFRIWHARRNVEMIVGIIMRDILCMKVRLIFTSASQRHHKPLTRWLIRRMDRVIATSVRSSSYLKVPHTVIMHGVDLEYFTPPTTKKNEFLASGIPGKYAIGCFGRIRYQKGTDLFVDAMIALLPRYPEWTAIIAGRTTAKHQKFEKALKEKIAAANMMSRIIFLGEVRNVHDWYQHLTLYVAPSRNEGFGLTPLEAMASQTAVVTSDAGAYTELVGPGSGTVVPAGNGIALQKAIESYLADPIQTIAAGRIALAHVRSAFPLIKEVIAIHAVYNNLLMSSNKPKDALYNP
ncbi:MAG: Glycosyl transferases group 1 protein [Candidatus Tokpelaia sp. JSC189]|nr:MAG: Glycosyl transferases group 1 protein [Candidatus Tokpelaia sp. JSC189]